MTQWANHRALKISRSSQSCSPETINRSQLPARCLLLKNCNNSLALQSPFSLAPIEPGRTFLGHQKARSSVLSELAITEELSQDLNNRIKLSPNVDPAWVKHSGWTLIERRPSNNFPRTSSPRPTSHPWEVPWEYKYPFWPLHFTKTAFTRKHSKCL